MIHSPASASGDQPPAGPGLTARDPAAGDLTAGDLTARLAADGELTAEDIAALARLDDRTPPLTTAAGTTIPALALALALAAAPAMRMLTPTVTPSRRRAGWRRSTTSTPPLWTPTPARRA